ncbi:multicopper oxidase family protein [Deinococcus humi]|uniref:FtsP/CotA-like multicopper oxidase with cupredoxin domain n=1 Tax=Deinococcus humi TaxID=662880 RepID=A0A7W8NHC6_9DEIO|nr:copper oxidase [Deinococcus humi]MBB5366406.1 FtsP/CotA-like multicopper oxidase with cupredoxin domain [Deinococcus humi]
MSGTDMGGGAPINSVPADSQTMPGMDMGGASSTAASTPAPLSQLPETPLQTPTRMGTLVMPPGMIMTKSMSMDAMRDMAAVDLNLVTYAAPPEARGDQPLTPTTVDGVKVFNFETSLIRWNILPDVQVAAYAVNRQVPGPRLQLTQGDQVRINVKNTLPESTTIHWHGLIVPNAMDGPADVTQKPIAPGQTFTYAFSVNQAGTYFYHSHRSPDRQQGLGLYGALLVAPKRAAAEPKADLEYTLQLQEWLQREGYTFPAMIMEGALPNFFTINGKAYPATDTIRMRLGQRVKLRFIGSNNNFVHPMHVHGGPFEVVARDGEVLKENGRFLADTLNVGPGQRYDVLWTAQARGTWLIHCHIPHHTTNDNVEQEGGGGLTMKIVVE